MPMPTRLIRTGDEPVHARSPLRMRLGLATWGLLWTLGGAVAFAIVGRPGWAAACGVLAVVTLVDLVLVIRHIRQGPHYQPGPDVPPYAPLGERRPGHGRRRAS
ncbi:Integral membrane protein OS=Streptomyces antimycoticus OX=68175 GN=SANT12839_028460 PE=4 SV=1 [Streptomyces antimycoticus]